MARNLRLMKFHQMEREDEANEEQDDKYDYETPQGINDHSSSNSPDVNINTPGNKKRGSKRDLWRKNNPYDSSMSSD